MKNALARMQPKDYIAALAILFIMVFKWQGFNGALDSVMALIVGYYFTKRVDGYDPGI